MRSTKRSFAAVIAAALVASVLALVASPAGALASVTATTRLSGADRYATASKVANPAGTTTNESHFVLVSGQSYADGLSASALAGALDSDGAAVLLTDPTTLTSSTLTAMVAMSGSVAAGAKYVHIVGGESAVSAGIATQLTASGFNVTRVAGSDRYKTADAVAAAVKTQAGGNIGTMGGYRTAFLVNGNGYADALAVSGYAYDAKLPVFMTDGTTLSAGTSAAIAAAKVQKVIVIGGTAAVSDAVKDAALAVSTVAVTQRVSGADRYATATALADVIAAVDTNRRIKAILVDGNNFPDGLAASQYAAAQDATILLVNGSTLPSSVSTWLTGKQAWLSTIATIGGTSAVPAAAVTAAKTAATKPAITATISKAVDNGKTFTVTFSERVVEANAEAAASYTICGKTGSCRVPTTDGSLTFTYTYTASTGVSKVVVANLGTALNPDDVLTVNGAAIGGYADNNVKVAKTSVTIAKNTAAPSGTVVAYPGAANAATKVWITWNMAVLDMHASNDVTAIDKLAGGTAATIDTCAIVTGTFTYTCHVGDTGQALEAGDIVKVALNAVTSDADTPVKSGAAFQTVVAADTTKPVLLSATYTTPVASTAASDQASLMIGGTGGGAGGASGNNGVVTGKGDVKITVLGSGPYAGKAGNAVKLAVDLAQAGLTGASCVFNAATKTIVVGVQAVTITAPAVATACNNAPTMQGNFVATAETATAGDYALASIADSTSGVAVGYALAGGKDKFNVTMTFSEPLSVWAAANTVVTTNCATSCNNESATVVTTAATEAAQELAGVITVSISSGTVPSAGLDKVTAATAILDRNANALTNALTPNTAIVFMQLGG